MRRPVSIATVLSLVVSACTNGGDVDATAASVVGSVTVGASAPEVPADSEWVNAATSA